MIATLDKRWWFVAAALVVCPLAAEAQSGRRALIAPGEPIAPAMLLSEGGPAGRDLAPLVGKRPVLGVYWRPGEAPSELALVNAAAVLQQVAPEAVLFPLAALAAQQSPATIPERLTALGITAPPREDTGQLAIMIGIRSVPGFFLLDAGGVLRLVGGVDITQAGGADQISIAEALALAGRGAPVPTLGVLPSDPIYRMLGRKLPDVNLTQLDGSTYRRLAQFVGQGKRLLIFYWSASCPHCKATWPNLAAWYKARRPDDLVLIDIARGDEPSLRADTAKLVADYPGVHLLDVDRSGALTLMVRETPTAFLVDKKGEIVGIRSGGDINWDRWLRPDPMAALKQGTR